MIPSNTRYNRNIDRIIVNVKETHVVQIRLFSYKQYVTACQHFKLIIPMGLCVIILNSAAWMAEKQSSPGEHRPAPLISSLTNSSPHC